MASLRRSNVAPIDSTQARFLWSILKQLDHKSIDWPLVAQDLEISNGHAARMRFSRFRSAMEGATPVPRKRRGENSSPSKSKKGKGTKKDPHAEDDLEAFAKPEPNNVKPEPNTFKLEPNTVKLEPNTDAQEFTAASPSEGTRIKREMTEYGFAGSNYEAESVESAKSGKRKLCDFEENQVVMQPKTVVKIEGADEFVSVVESHMMADENALASSGMTLRSNTHVQAPTESAKVYLNVEQM